MVSAIDPTLPISGSSPGPTTASVRSNFQIAHDEITALQAAGGGTDSVAGGITATPSGTISTSFQLTAQFNIITTCASGAGVALPSAGVGTHCKVRNSGANTLTIFPKNGDNAAINAQAVNTSVTVLPNTTAYFEGQSITQWFTVP